MPQAAKKFGGSDKPKVDDRRSASSRGYDRTWQRFRDSFLRANPVCDDCGQPASEVHHVQKVVKRPDLRLEPENCRPLCKACHSRRTAKGE